MAKTPGSKPPPVSAPSISGDRPIEAPAEDKLGFYPLAQRLASALIDQGSSEGLVVGLEGEWGSGKSSLLNLTVRALGELPETHRPIVVDFKPWLIGDRDALLRVLFGQLAASIESIQAETGESEMAEGRRRRELAKQVRGYAAGVGAIGGLVGVIPGVGVIGKAAEAVAKVAETLGADKALPDLKRELDHGLAGLSRRIVVTVDDVDRLDPREAIEVLRLIRSVADFRNVVYVLCFDEEVVGKSIEAALSLKDGSAYLEKILQVIVAVPIPEPFRLRRWLEQEMKSAAARCNEDAQARLAQVIDKEGGRRLKTPRSVTRVANAIRLLEPALRDEVDLADLLWLQLIRGQNPKLYRWIEEYCAEVSASTGWRVSISKREAEKRFEKLETALKRDDLDYVAYSYELAEHLPGIDRIRQKSDDKGAPIHRKLSDTAVEKAIADRRLASPDHYRLYFALAQPALSPKREDFDGLLQATEASVAAVVKTLEGWLQQKDPIIGSKLELMLDRFQKPPAGSLTEAQAANFILALGDVLDEGVDDGYDALGSPALWREAGRALTSALQSMGERQRKTVVRALFRNGTSIGWLTFVLRNETFGHGRYGDKREPESEWILSDAELDIATTEMLKRYRQLKLAGIRTLRRPISTLFAWAQGGDLNRVRDMITKHIATEEGLVDLLELMSSRVHSSDGSYQVLSRHNLDTFLDYDAAKERVAKLTAGRGQLKARAAVLAGYFERAIHF
jgi:hypothetical protein